MFVSVFMMQHTAYIDMLHLTAAVSRRDGTKSICRTVNLALTSCVPQLYIIDNIDQWDNEDGWLQCAVWQWRYDVMIGDRQELLQQCGHTEGVSAGECVCEVKCGHTEGLCLQGHVYV
jgi:hypothetical protein